MSPHRRLRLRRRVQKLSPGSTPFGQNARAAHNRFMASADAARNAARRARGASRASTAWSSAQVAIADLETLRSLTGVPLADLDRLYVDATIDFTRRNAIGEARDEVIALVATEDRILAELGSIVGP